MKRRHHFLVYFIFLCLTTLSYAQKLDVTLLLVPENLKEKANSIILNQSTEVEIISQSKYTEKTSKTIMVLNEFGVKNIDAIEYYSKNNSINNITATVYDKLGKKIKSYRKSDFSDQSTTSGGTIIGDGRVLYLKITPIEYPFVVVFESETSSSNTAFLPQWHPLDDPNESVAKSSFIVKFADGLGFKHKTVHFENYDIIKKEFPNEISFELKNALAFQQEDFSPCFISLAPQAVFSLEKFSLEGVDGQAQNWIDFGNWMNISLLQGMDELPDFTIAKIRALVGSEKDPIAKAKIVYKYVQEKVRYVSIQLGIGGWKPMPAKDVERLGYGDCKALSNYTKALLNAVDVPSFYTIIYGGSQKQNIDSDFFRMQGNHAILALPVENGFKFLECTSQTNPFGYQGNFTDDRDALVVQPDKTQIVHTKKYVEAESTQHTIGVVSIDDSGKINASASVTSSGVQFDNVDDIVRKNTDDILEHYRTKFAYINNIVLQKPTLKTDRETIIATENFSFSADGFAQKTGNQLFFAPNVFSQGHRIPQRYRNRINPFEVEHGFIITDEIIIEIPAGFAIDAMTDKLEVSDKFGSYLMTCEKIAANKILYKRTYRLNTNIYPKTDYENFRKFIEKIAQYDGSKIVLKKV